MALRLFALYVLLELAAVVALVYTVGFGWAVLTVVATFALGVLLAGSQARSQLRKLQNGLTAPQGAIADSALVALGTLLVLTPGLVTTVAGLLIMLPPTRAIARPAIGAAAARSLGKRTTFIGTFPTDPRPRGDYIDGEVIDVVDVDQPAIPPAVRRKTDSPLGGGTP
ncbi:MAG: FxsA family protein [Mycobacterium sp.]